MDVSFMVPFFLDFFFYTFAQKYIFKREKVAT